MLSRSILQYVWPVLSDMMIGLENQFFVFFLSGRLRQVLLYTHCVCVMFCVLVPGAISIFVVVLLLCEDWLLCFNYMYILAVGSLFPVFSSRCRELVYGICMWQGRFMLTCFKLLRYPNQSRNKQGSTG